MRKKIVMICGMLATSFLFTGCEDTDTHKSPNPPSTPNLEALLELLHEQFPALANSAAESGRTAVAELPSVAESSFETRSKFELQAKHPQNICYIDDNAFKVDWYLYNNTMGTWSFWGSKITKCVGDAATRGINTINGNTHVIFFAYVYHKSSGQLFGSGYSNWLYLKNP